MYVGFDTCVLYNIVVLFALKILNSHSIRSKTNLQFKDDIHYLLSSSILDRVDGIGRDPQFDVDG